MQKMKRAKPCLHCGSKNIVWKDCGYSSFNCGTVKCEGCGFELNLENLGCLPESEIRSAWNGQRNKAIRRLKKLRQEVKELEKILGDDA